MVIYNLSFSTVISSTYLITWIDGSTNDPPQRIPGPVIKPVVEFIKSFFCQEAGGTVVEVTENKTGIKIKT